MDEDRRCFFVRSGTLATVQTVRGIGNSVVPGKMTSVASERGLDIMRTKFSVIADRKWDPIGAGPSENYAQFETKQVVRLSHENRFAFSPQSFQTRDGRPMKPHPEENIAFFLFLPLTRYKVGIKFAIVCLEAKKTPFVKALALEFPDLFLPRFLPPVVVGCRLLKLTVSNGSRRLNTPITSRCQNASAGKEARERLKDVSKHGGQSARL